VGVRVQGLGRRIQSSLGFPRPSEEGKSENVLTTFAGKPRPESGLDRLRCAIQGYLAHKKCTPLGPYRRPRSRVLGGSWRGGRCHIEV
jgi:hypothetical protein